MASKVQMRKTVTLPDGRKIVKNFNGNTKKEVNKKYADFIRSIEEESRESTVIYFSQVADEYLYSKGASAVTMVGYKTKVDILKKVFRERLIDSIQYDELQRYINSLSNFSVNTVRKYITHIKGIFAFALEQGYINKSPALKLKPSPTVKKARTPQWYTAEEARKLMDHAKGCGKKGLAVIIPLKAGLRPGEVAALNIARDVDFASKEIHVKESIKISQSGERVGKTKTQTSERVVPIDDELVECLLPYKQQGYLFDNGKGKPINYNNFLHHYIDAVFEGAPVEQLHPHDLRHTYGTLLYESGTNLYDIMSVMGHSDIKVTQIYVHQDMRKLAERIRLVY